MTRRSHNHTLSLTCRLVRPWTVYRSVELLAPVLLITDEEQRRLVPDVILEVVLKVALIAVEVTLCVCRMLKLL